MHGCGCWCGCRCGRERAYADCGVQRQREVAAVRARWHTSMRGGTAQLLLMLLLLLLPLVKLHRHFRRSERKWDREAGHEDAGCCSGIFGCGPKRGFSEACPSSFGARRYDGRRIKRRGGGRGVGHWHGTVAIAASTGSSTSTAIAFVPLGRRRSAPTAVDVAVGLALVAVAAVGLRRCKMACQREAYLLLRGDLVMRGRREVFRAQGLRDGGEVDERGTGEGGIGRGWAWRWGPWGLKDRWGLGRLAGMIRILGRLIMGLLLMLISLMLLVVLLTMLSRTTRATTSSRWAGRWARLRLRGKQGVPCSSPASSAATTIDPDVVVTPTRTGYVRLRAQQCWVRDARDHLQPNGYGLPGPPIHHAVPCGGAENPRGRQDVPMPGVAGDPFCGAGKRSTLA